MAIDDDLRIVEKLQNDFKTAHGAYFEMDWAAQKIEVPSVGAELALTKIKRFVPSGVSDSVIPAKEIKEIPFAPTAKDWRFCIGRGISRDRKTGLLAAECWYCQASRIDANRDIEQKYIGGGDVSMLKADGVLTEAGKIVEKKIVTAETDS